jgi:prepilin-type N-terminal cleavage/methylation domain-containing protein
MNGFIKQAFTLIELLVVIAIIGILSGLIVVSMSGITEKANIAKSQVFSNSLRNSLILNLISEWKMDEGANQSIIDGWGGINGTLGSTVNTDTNDPTWITNGCISGNCLNFDGSNDYAMIAYADKLNMHEGSITVSSWINLRTFSSSFSEIFYGGATGSGHGYGYMINSSGSLYYEIHGTSGGRQFFTINANISLNRWHNIVMTFDSSNNNLRLYRDGLIFDDRTISDPGDVINDSTFKIGSYHSGAVYFLDGLVDEIRIFNASVPKSQAREQYYIGINKLLINKQISKEDYIKEASELAIDSLD